MHRRYSTTSTSPLYHSRALLSEPAAKRVQLNPQVRDSEYKSDLPWSHCIKVVSTNGHLPKLRLMLGTNARNGGQLER